jgi:hypothetical protein
VQETKASSSISALLGSKQSELAGKDEDANGAIELLLDNPVLLVRSETTLVIVLLSLLLEYEGLDRPIRQGLRKKKRMYVIELLLFADSRHWKAVDEQCCAIQS